MITPSQQRWQLLYKAAILENDRSRVGYRIFQAQRAIADRSRELNQNTEQHAQVEKEAMEDALYTLRALATAGEHTLHAA